MRANGCSWATDWGLSQGPAVATTAIDSTACQAFKVSRNGTDPIVGLNLADDQQRRCPTWTACPFGGFCCLAKIVPGRTTCAHQDRRHALVLGRQ